MLTKRENATKERGLYLIRLGSVISGFEVKEFRSLDAVTTIAAQYYPEITKKAVYDFWHNRSMNLDLLAQMENVLEILKSE